MPGRDFEDDAELRPLGEATHVPDHELDTKRDDQHRGSTRPGYPADVESTSECRSCGTSVPSSRTKCRFAVESRRTARYRWYSRRDGTPSRRPHGRPGGVSVCRRREGHDRHLVRPAQRRDDH